MLVKPKITLGVTYFLCGLSWPLGLGMETRGGCKLCGIRVYSRVEVLPKKKAVNAKGTKRPITTPMQSAKKRPTVKTSGRK